MKLNENCDGAGADDNIAGERRNGGEMEQEFAVGGDEFAGARGGDGDVDEEVAAEISGEEEDEGTINISILDHTRH